MGGFFGVVSKDDCVADLFYGTDYHSHLGTSRGGMVVRVKEGFKRNIHDICNTPFRTKFEEDLPKYKGRMGLGVISDYEDQPLLVGSRHGRYAIVTVGRLDNLNALAEACLGKNSTLTLPAPTSTDRYMDQAAAVVFQVVRDDSAECWSSSFADSKKNRPTLFKAKKKE